MFCPVKLGHGINFWMRGMNYDLMGRAKSTKAWTYRCAFVICSAYYRPFNSNSGQHQALTIFRFFLDPLYDSNFCVGFLVDHLLDIAFD